MSWRVSAGFAIVISAGAMGVVSSPVRADEAYLCGPDKVVYVAVADLEHKKRTDPCIAAYYGLKVDVAVAAQPVAPPSAAAPAKAEPKPLAALKPLSHSEIPERVERAAVRQAALEPPRATAGTDYRNVKILNAPSEGARWFHHTR
jgi:hypothetical protein